jgi:hypothetical protein
MSMMVLEEDEESFILKLPDSFWLVNSSLYRCSIVMLANTRLDQEVMVDRGSCETRVKNE